MTDGTNFFVAVANYYSGATYATNSFIYKWNAATGCAVVFSCACL